MPKTVHIKNVEDYTIIDLDMDSSLLEEAELDSSISSSGNDANESNTAKSSELPTKISENIQTLNSKMVITVINGEGSSVKYPSLPCEEYITAKGFKCPQCQRTYNARKNLVRHINLECGREPQYKCPHCPHGNHRRNELKRHIQKKHHNKPPP